MQIGVIEPKDFSQQVLHSLEKLGDVSLFLSGDINDFIMNKEILFIRLKYLISVDFLFISFFFNTTFYFGQKYF